MALFRVEAVGMQESGQIYQGTKDIEVPRFDVWSNVGSLEEGCVKNTAENAVLDW